MKANELRIGNLITIDNSVYWSKLKDVPLIVVNIGQTMNIKGESSHSVGCEHINQKANTYYETYSQFIENIKPISLTEEWLLKLGFIKHGATNEWFAKDWGRNGVAIIKYHSAYERFCYEFGQGYNKILNHVHQLQNLFYA